MAVLAVVAYHAGLPVPGGFLGVDVFFVISGFVITSSLAREWADTGRLSLSGFYFRRLKRLMPALSAMVVVVLVISIAVLSPLGGQQEAAMTGAGALLLGANFVLQRTVGGYFDLDADINPLLHTWSLSVEEQIYLVVPLVLGASWLLARLTQGRWIPFAALAVITALSLACVFFPPLASRLPETLGGFFGPVPRVWEFGVGVLLALLPLARLPRVAATVLGFVGFSCVAAGFMLVSEQSTIPGPGMALPVFGVAAIIAAGAVTSDHPVARVLRVRPMTALGDLSYSWYLWHWPFVVFGGLLFGGEFVVGVIAAGLSLLPAVVSYRYLEQPVRVKILDRTRGRAALVAAVLVPPLFVASAVGGLAAAGYGSPVVNALQDGTMPLHETYLAGCTWEIYEVDDTRCEWNRDSTSTPLYLIGDSNADHFAEALIEVAEDLDRPLETALASGCPPLTIAITRDILGEAGRQRCEVFAASTQEWLDTAPRGTVVLAMTSTYWSSEVFAVGLPGAQTTDSDEKLDEFRRALSGTLTRLTTAGHDVVVVQPIPRFGWDPQACSLATIVAGACVGSVSQSALEPAQRETWGIVREVADAAGARVLDLTPILCPSECTTVSEEGVVMYRDPDHISVPGAIALSGTFRDAVVSGRESVLGK